MVRPQFNPGPASARSTLYITFPGILQHFFGGKQLSYNSSAASPIYRLIYGIACFDRGTRCPNAFSILEKLDATVPKTLLRLLGLISIPKVLPLDQMFAFAL